MKSTKEWINELAEKADAQMRENLKAQASCILCDQPTNTKAHPPEMGRIHRNAANAETSFRLKMERFYPAIHKV